MNSRDQEFDDEIASIDSQTNVIDHNAPNDIIDSQLNSKENDDNDDDDDDDDWYVLSSQNLIFFLSFNSEVH